MCWANRNPAAGEVQLLFNEPPSMDPCSSRSVCWEVQRVFVLNLRLLIQRYWQRELSVQKCEGLVSLLLMCSYISHITLKKTGAAMYILLYPTISWVRILPQKVEGNFLSTMNSYNSTMKYKISSKTRCCVAKSETARSLSPHSRCPTKAHDRGVSAQCWFAPQARQTEWLLAGSWWQPLPSVPDWQSTAWRLYRVWSQDPKAFQNLAIFWRNATSRHRVSNINNGACNSRSSFIIVMDLLIRK